MFVYQYFYGCKSGKEIVTSENREYRKETESEFCPPGHELNAIFSLNNELHFIFEQITIAF